MRAILTYHSVDPSDSAISINEGRFRQHVAWLASGVVRVVTLERLLQADAPDDAVALTFDDAFANFDDVAWPLLRAHGMSATLYVVSGHAGRDNAWGGVRSTAVPTLRLMDWDAIGRVAHDGVTIGAHSRTHPDLRRVPNAALEEEIAGSAQDIAARTGKRPTSFAYPYGGADRRVITAAAKHYRTAVTTELRALDRDDSPLRLPRLDAFYLREPGRLESWGTPAFRSFVRRRAALRGLRALMTGRPA